jgi:hypothetical protein
MLSFAERWIDTLVKNIDPRRDPGACHLLLIPQ